MVGEVANQRVEKRLAWSGAAPVFALVGLGTGIAMAVVTQSLGVEATQPAPDQSAAIEQLRKELDQTSFRLALVEARAQETNYGNPEAVDDIRATATAIGLLNLRQQSRTDRPFAAELSLIRPLLSRQPDGEMAVAPLLAYADAGVPSLDNLAVEYRRLQPLLMAQVEASESDKRGRLDIFRSLLAAVHLAPEPEPSPALAVLEQVDIDLSRGRLDTAVTAIESLEPPVSTIASGWLAAAGIRLALDRNVDALVQSAVASMVAER
jgi:hypothetical protein